MLTGTPFNHGTPFPSYNPQFGGYDPLAVGFMSQGQMGYMPQQQFLTPAGYGAFRTMPSTTGYGQMYQRPSFWQNLAYANNGHLFGVPVPTYNPMVDAVTRRGMARMGITDDTLAFGATALDTTISALSFLNPYTAVANMVMPGVGNYMSDVQGHTRNLQRMSMPKINFGPDVNRLTGMGFSTSKAMGIEQFIRKSAAGDPFMKQEDYREIMKYGMENNLFDYSNSAESYKKVIKRLRNQTDVMLEVIDDKNLEGVMKNLKRLQDMGASGDMATSISRHENMFSRMTGMRHSDMVNSYGQQGALIYSQMGLTGYQGSLSAMGAAANLTMSQKLGIIDPGTLNRLGGASGYVQRVTEESAGARQVLAQHLLPFISNSDFSGIDQSKLNDLVTGKISFTEATQLGARNINNASSKTMYDANKDRLTEQMFNKLGPVLDKLLQVLVAQEYGSKFAGISDPKSAIQAGLMHLFKMSPETASVMANQYSNKDMVNGLKEQSLREAQAAAEKELNKRRDERFWSPITGIKEALFETFGSPVIGALSNWNARMDAVKGASSVFTPWGFTGTGQGNTSDTIVKNPGYQDFTLSPSNVMGEHNTGDITALSAQFESNNGADQIGYDKRGGTSYGKYQISSKQGTMTTFLDYIIATSNNPEAVAHAKKMKQMRLNTGSERGAAVDAWNHAVKNNLFTLEQQKDFITKTHYDVALENIRKRNPELAELIESDHALKSSLFSTAVQHGPNIGDKRQGAPAIFLDSWREGMTKEELINSVYATRGKFSPATMDRYRDEGAAALGMLAQSRITLTGDIVADQGAYKKEIEAIRHRVNPEGFRFVKDVETYRDKLREELTQELGLIYPKDGVASGDAMTASHMSDGKDILFNEKMLVATSVNLSDSTKDVALKKIGLTKGQFEAYSNERLNVENIGALMPQMRTVLKDILKAKNPNMSDEELAAKVESLSKDPDVKKLFANKAGMLNKEMRDDSTKYFNDYRKEKNALAQSFILEKMQGEEANLRDILGSDAGKMMDLMKSTNGDALNILAMSANLQRYQMSTLDPNYSDKERENRRREVVSAAKALGMDEDSINKMIESGDFTNIKNVSGDDIAAIKAMTQKVLGYKPGGRGRSNATYGINSILGIDKRMKTASMFEQSHALDLLLENSGHTLSDLTDFDSITKMLEKGGLSPELTTFLQDLAKHESVFKNNKGTQNIYDFIDYRASKVLPGLSVGGATTTDSEGNVITTPEMEALNKLVTTQSDAAANLSKAATALETLAAEARKEGTKTSNTSVHNPSYRPTGM